MTAPGPAALDLFLLRGPDGRPLLQVRMNAKDGRKVRSVSYDFTTDEAVTLLAHLGVMVYSLLAEQGLTPGDIHTRLLAAHDQASAALREQT